MNRFVKRVLDFFTAGIALIVLSPLIGLVAAIIYLAMGRPVCFQHVRPGYQAMPFKLWKFRTMTNARDSSGNLLPDEQRLTRCGALLRRSSLDELPQLWNVLKGEMSLVGPRPLLMEYLSMYTAAEARRHEVKPGLTGWAQVNGRNALSWPARLNLDCWYVEHWSLALDVQILLRTIFQVIMRSNISYEGHATMPRFTRGDRTEP
ncbi:MAG TPA: sugar transferase [Candidatus Acidoferrales bacterium]|nr:sugar transferase [Candidatus Acidoferrales bacterium]